MDHSIVGGADIIKHLAVKLHQIHLVHSHYNLGDTQQRCNAGVPYGLLHDSVTGIHQYHGQISCRCTRNHVASVLYVSRGIGYYELALWGGKVPVGHIYGYALLTLGTQSVGKQRQVDLLVASAARSLLYSLKLILEYRL